MNRSQFTLGVRVVATLLSVASFAVIASAQSAGGRAELTFSAPVRVPGITLAAGTYVFQRLESNRDTGTMQVFSVKPRRLMATVKTSPVTRAGGGGNVVFRMTSAGITPALGALYIDGGAAGAEFIYSSGEQRQLVATPAIAKPAAVVVAPGAAVIR